MKLPLAYKIESDYKPLFATHGFFPIDLDNPMNLLTLTDQTLSTPHLAIADMDSISQQLISNQPGSRMKKDIPFRAVKKSKGYKINQAFIQPLLQINEISLMIMGNITFQGGYKLFGGNLAIALFSALEYKNKQIHGKFLEIVYPEDPEYPEDEIDEEEEIDEDEIEGETGEEEMDEENFEEEIESNLLGEDKNRVCVNLIDIDQL